jgi:hypothetical protein
MVAQKSQQSLGPRLIRTHRMRRPAAVARQVPGKGDGQRFGHGSKLKRLRLIAHPT